MITKILLFCISLLAFVLTGCNSAVRPDDWVNRPPDFASQYKGWHKLSVAKDYVVLDNNEFQAVQGKLEVQPVIEINSESSFSLPLRKGKRYFILRAAENPSVWRRGNDYYVISVVMSHHNDVSVAKSAILVSADLTPRMTYMSYSIDE